MKNKNMITFKVLKEAFVNQHFSPIEMGWSEEEQKLLATAFLTQLKNANEFTDIALTPRDENNDFLTEYQVNVNQVKNFVKTLSVNDVEKVMGNSYNKKENARGYFTGNKVNYITGTLIVAKKKMNTPNGEVECYIKITAKDHKKSNNLEKKVFLI